MGFRWLNMLQQQVVCSPSFAYSIFSGSVELLDLPLRKDALRNLGLPLQALKGTVGRIKLEIPVRQFRTAPWCIIVENVYVVIGPINLDEVTICLICVFKSNFILTVFFLVF